MGKQQHTPQPPPQYYYEEDTISLTDILLVLAKQLKLLVITPLILGVITAFYVLFIAQPVFVSSAKIMSSSSGGGSTSQLRGLAAQFGVSVPMGDEGVEQWVYPDIIKSRILARAMLQQKFNTVKYGPQKSLLQILTYGDEEPTVASETLIKLGVNSFLEMIGVEKDRVTTIYTITVSAFEPQFATDLCAVLIDELDEHQRKYKTAKVKETRLFIEGRIVEVQIELREAEEILKEFRDRNRQIQQSPTLLLAQQRLIREATVLTGVFTTLKQQLEMIKIEEVRESSVIQVIDPPEAPLFRNSPKRKRSVLLSLFLGFGVAVAGAFVREYANKSNEEEKGKFQEIIELTKTNIIGLIQFRKKRE